jgi:pyruvate kinase
MATKTKIVCTIGPASWDSDVMKKMIEAGMNCARVNGAFANPDELDKVTKLVRDVSSKVSLMMDVKGPEVRMNKFSEPKAIKPGDKIEIGNDPSSEVYPANYPNLYTHLTVGQRIVIGDGDTELKIVDIVGDKMICEVVFGEILKPGKAMNLPGANYAISTLTEKDIENLLHSIKLGWDYVSASFIQDAESANEVKKYLAGTDMKLIAKIEDQLGVDNIDEILEVVDGIMVARGGLGVELGLEKVPMVQRKLIQKAISAGKIVITATQMLESMISNPRPTRAEVNDVATAILLGTDSVMLSAETSAGAYPVEAVSYMTSIATEIESHIQPTIINDRTHGPISTDAIAKAAASIAIQFGSDIKCVIVVSRSGRTARMISRHSIQQPIHTFVKRDHYTRHLSIAKGITTADVVEQSVYDRDQAIEMILSQAKKLGYVSVGDRILFVSKVPFDQEQFFPNIFEVIDVK